MRRDLNLIRQIILAVEESPTGYLRNDLNSKGFTPEQIEYHSYLIVDAGLAAGNNVTTLGDRSPNWRIQHHTSAGHDFADAARDDGTWQKAMGMVKDKAGV